MYSVIHFNFDLETYEKSGSVLEAMMGSFASQQGFAIV